MRAHRIVVAATGTLIVAGALWSSAGASGASTPQPPSVAPPGLEAGIVQAARQRQANLRSPAARAVRRRSLTAFRGQSSHDAKALARENFPTVAARPAYSAKQTVASNHVRGFLRNNVAEVDGPDGTHSVLMSSDPMRIGGRWVDLSLDQTANGFAPAVSPTPVTISAQAADGFRLPNDVTAQPAVANQAAGAVSAGSVFYGNVDTDTDLLVRPVPMGAETFWQLRSPQASESYALRFGLPAGASLRERRGALGADNPLSMAGVEIVGGSEVLATVSMPQAMDAQGRSVPVDMRVIDDRSLRIEIAHRSADLAYPIMLDPTVASVPHTYGPTYGFGNNSFDFAILYNPDSSWYAASYEGPEGLAVGGLASQPFNSSMYAWAFKSSLPNTHWIWARLEDYTHFPNNSFAFGGIYNPVAGAWAPGYAAVDDDTGGYNSTQAHRIPGSPDAAVSFDGDSLFNSNREYCATKPCRQSGTADTNWVSFGIGHWAPTGPDYPSQAHIAGAYLDASEDHAPTASISHTVDLNGWINDQTDTVSVHASDVGLGLRSLLLGGDGVSQKEQDLACDGDPADRPPCPLSGDFQISYDTSHMQEGINHLGASVVDIVSNATSYNWDLKLDRTAPSVELTGPVKDANGGTVIGDNELNVSASDARAGVKTITVAVDGITQNEATVAQGCGTDGCDLEDVFVLHGDSFSVGSHTITARAVDNAGNATTSSVSVNLAHDGEPSPDSPPAQTSTTRACTDSAAGPSDAAAVVNGSWVGTARPGYTPAMGAPTNGLETTEYFPGGSYRASRCDLTGGFLNSQLVVPTRLDDGRIVMLPVETGLADSLSGERNYQDALLLASGDPALRQRYDASATTVTARTIPPTVSPTLLGFPPRPQARDTGQGESAATGSLCGRNDYHLLRYGWGPRSAGYYNNQNNLPSGELSAQRLRDGHRTWNDTLNYCHYRDQANFFWEFKGRTERSPTAHDDFNVVGFQSGPCGDHDLAIACTNLWGDNRGFIHEADIALDTRVNWWSRASTNVPLTAYDVRGVVVHEVGHTLGLAHNPDNYDSVMYPNADRSQGEARMRYLAKADVGGMRALYPQH